MWNPVLWFFSSPRLWGDPSKKSTDKHIRYAKNNQDKFHVNDRWLKYVQKISSSKIVNTISAMWPIIPACYQTVEILNYEYIIDSCDITNADRSVTHLSSVECSYTYNNQSLKFSSNEDVLCDTQTDMYFMFGFCFVFYISFFCILHSNYVFTKYSLKLMAVNARIVASSYLNKLLVVNFIMVIGFIGFGRYFANNETCTRFVGRTEIDINLVLSQGNVWAGVFQFVLLYSCIFSLLMKQIQDPWLAYVKFSDFVHKVQYLDYPLHAIDFEVKGDLQEIQRTLRIYYNRYKKDEDEKIILCAAVRHLLKRGSAKRIEYEIKDTEASNSSSNQPAVVDPSERRNAIKRKQKINKKPGKPKSSKSKDKNVQVDSTTEENPITESLLDDDESPTIAAL